MANGAAIISFRHFSDIFMPPPLNVLESNCTKLHQIQAWMTNAVPPICMCINTTIHPQIKHP